MLTHPSLSAIVLAGGRSRRMGQDKALLPVAGQPLLVHVLRRLEGLSDDLIVAAGDAERYTGVLSDAPPVRCVGDVAPDAGPLSGMCAGLSAARHAQAVVVACDMPFLNLTLLGWMAGLLPRYDAVVPRVMSEDVRLTRPVGQGSQVRAKDAGWHPLHAIYSATCLEPMGVMLERRERSLGNLLASLRVRAVESDEITSLDPHLLSLRNVNTPEEFAACLRLL